MDGVEVTESQCRIRTILYTDSADRPVPLPWTFDEQSQPINLSCSHSIPTIPSTFLIDCVGGNNPFSLSSLGMRSLGGTRTAIENVTLSLFVACSNLGLAPPPVTSLATIDLNSGQLDSRSSSPICHLNIAGSSTTSSNSTSVSTPQTTTRPSAEPDKRSTTFGHFLKTYQTVRTTWTGSRDSSSTHQASSQTASRSQTTLRSLTRRQPGSKPARSSRSSSAKEPLQPLD